MAVGLSSAFASSILDALGNATNITAPTAFWIKLHTADPGAAGATAAAVNTTRKQVSFGAASAGAIANDAAVTWTSGEVTTTETYTHWSAWTLVTAGTFLCSGTVSNGAVTSGTEFSIPIGDLDLVISNVAA